MPKIIKRPYRLYKRKGKIYRKKAGKEKEVKNLGKIAMKVIKKKERGEKIAKIKSKNVLNQMVTDAFKTYGNVQNQTQNLQMIGTVNNIQRALNEEKEKLDDLKKSLAEYKKTGKVPDIEGILGHEEYQTLEGLFKERHPGMSKEERDKEIAKAIAEYAKGHRNQIIKAHEVGGEEQRINSELTKIQNFLNNLDANKNIKTSINASPTLKKYFGHVYDAAGRQEKRDAIKNKGKLLLEELKEENRELEAYKEEYKEGEATVSEGESEGMGGCEPCDGGSNPKGYTDTQINLILDPIRDRLKYAGTFDKSEFIDFLNKTDSKNFSCIFNTVERGSNIIGHWIAVNVKDYTFEYFDSLTLDPDDEIMEAIKGYSLRISPDVHLKLKYNKLQIQNKKSFDCGIFCVTFLMLRRIFLQDFSDASNFTNKDIVQGTGISFPYI